MVDSEERTAVERTAVGDEGATVHIEGVELPPEDVVVVPTRPAPLPVRAVYLVLGVGLFVTALGLMKEGAAELIPTLAGSVFTDNAWSTLGLGWLGACIVLSGSPVAASALTLLDGGVIDRTQLFTMLMGSRLGAAFVVLVVGMIYALRHKGGGGRRAPISIGILSLLMTAVVYVPASVLGYLLLDRGVLDRLDIGTSPAISSATDAAFGWAVDLAQAAAPGWMLFLLGLAVLLLGFRLFDKVLPSVGGEQLEDRPGAWYTRRFCLGVARGALHSPARLAGCVAVLFVVPLTLIAV